MSTLRIDSPGRRLAALALTTALAWPLSSVAAPPTIEISLTGHPTAWFVQGMPAHIDGYGRATFGMGVDEVKAIVAADHPAGAASLKDEIDPASGRRALTVVVPQLAPGPGPATLNYVFDGSRLVAVNVSWIAPAPSTTAQRAALVAAAQAVGSETAGFMWPPLASIRGQLLPDAALIVFAGKDARGRGLEIRLDGVDVDVQPRAPTATSAAMPPEHRVAPGGPARLRVAYADAGRADAPRIAPGDF